MRSFGLLLAIANQSAGFVTANYLEVTVALCNHRKSFMRLPTHDLRAPFAACNLMIVAPEALRAVLMLVVNLINLKSTEGCMSAAVTTIASSDIRG